MKFCPDCRQKLNQPQKPVGWLNGQPVWCATCEDSRPKDETKPANRPPLPRDRVRLPKTYRILPETADKIGKESARTGESAGEVVDRLAQTITNAIK